MKEERIQKIIASNLNYSRRKAEELIKSGRVKCNGKKVCLGDRGSYKDRIEIDGVILEVEKNREKIYLMLNKPRGYVTTMKDERGRKNISDLIYPKIKERVYPIGRLDLRSQGLLLLTNDGEFSFGIMHPKNEIEKVYMVSVNKEITKEEVKKLEEGVCYEGVKTKPCRVEVLFNSKEKSRFKITISEGKKRQIRNMVKAILGEEVRKLKRTQIGTVKLKNLPLGEFRSLTKEEVLSLKSLIKN